MKGNTLGDFLRTRRASLAPTDRDRTAMSRRRVPGLRREEVAHRVGVSVDYYTRLEQGHRCVPSEGVLTGLADVLQLDQPARVHMRDLVWSNSRPKRPDDSTVQQARPGMLRLMESFDGLPVVLLGRRTDILAANATARLLIADFNAMPARARNAVRFVLLSERARRLHVDWEAAAAGLVGMLRMDAGRHPDDPRIAELVDELSARSEHFTRLWNDWQVATSIVPESKVLRHPLVGHVSLHVEAVTTPRDPDQTLQVLMPTDPASRAAVRQLQALTDTK
jgi:transcriptional regulator with XRE-family HTH domain